MPQEDHIVTYRMLQKAGIITSLTPSESVAKELSTKAVKAAYKTAEVTGKGLKVIMGHVAKQSGYLANSETAERVVSKMWAHVPSVPVVEAIFRNIQLSYEEGKQMANRGRSGNVSQVESVQDLTRGSLEASSVQRRSRPPTKLYRSRAREGFESVPLNRRDEDELAASDTEYTYGC